MNTINVGGAPIAVREIGEGRPVVLLHCTGGSGGQWRGVAEALFANTRSGDFRLIMPDLHGHGKSPCWTGRGPMRLVDEAAIVSAIVEELGEPVHLVGHSYGGTVALRAALELPAMLNSLTLIEPVAFFLLRDGDAEDSRLLAEIGGLADAVSSGAVTGDFRAPMAGFVDYWSGAGTWASLPEDAKSALVNRIQTVALNFAATISERTRLSATQTLRVPTLLLQGDRTRPIAKRLIQLLMCSLPNATLKTVPGGGHMAPLTHAAAVAEAIAPHLVGRHMPLIPFLEHHAA
ncbi:MAG: alpha/beta hydrolase [Alphaproteobacteria bacterium]|nr:alpha/beta hydrolase [Alphaproteobacteria bacterium]